MTLRHSILSSLILGIFLSFCCTGKVHAQVPRNISYQGLLLKNNQPVTGLVNLHVRIYNTAGTALYEEGFDQLQVFNGVFNILIGGEAGSIPPSLKFNEQYFLGVEIDSTGEMTPRTPLSATPYALNSQTVGGFGVSVTPQPGKLLPLDANGKFPSAVLPVQANAITQIDNVGPDANGKITFVNGGGINIVDNALQNQITLSVSLDGLSITGLATGVLHSTSGIITSSLIIGKILQIILLPFRRLTLQAL
jgi:hypothetical protein